MKVLMLNGSPRKNGNTSIALKEMEKIFKQEGIETELIHVGNKGIRSCIACGACAEKGKCVFDDIVNEIAPKFEECDGLVVGSPCILCFRKRYSCGAPYQTFLQHLLRQDHEGRRQRCLCKTGRPFRHI